MLNFSIQYFSTLKLLQRIDNIFNGWKVFLPTSILSGANFNVYPQFYRIVFSDCVASLKDFCTASTKRLLTQCLLRKYKSKAYDK